MSDVLPPAKPAHPHWPKVLFSFLLGTLFGVILTVVLFGPRISTLVDTTISQNKKLADEATENLNQRTLLYDPKANFGLATSGTPITEAVIGNRANPKIGYPRWIIIGKIKPTIMGNSEGVKYSYYDPRTDSYDGPFVPDLPVIRP